MIECTDIKKKGQVFRWENPKISDQHYTLHGLLFISGWAWWFIWSNRKKMDGIERKNEVRWGRQDAQWVQMVSVGAFLFLFIIVFNMCKY